ncbi:ABC transporter ATP-binding protein [Conexibacter woesei]|uniref:Oligopeptide/dipeptide ABC transporter, ATPase subunit n=1 Tax=Conexibacter woesei (strain DSM 14684 / CCUG 47730 / CIP 108061 / JCM 11494 / NBRC 100937 / ID131577) TaxID=469383 RepID=D3F1S8_CONWI|nr:ABC transporter ATP-binding protein [Conexibacter woesei]ADB54109.1 oligopeptide/dipeptide ABC transporter, ATPase subunit [Conexibacter woesei DSM 14684]
MSAALEITNLSLALGEGAARRDILGGVGVRCERGEVVGLVGESGSGKSMTLRSVLGLLPRGAQVSGSVTVGDVDVLTCPPEELREIRRKRVSIIFQDPRAHINPARRIGDFLTEGMVRNGVAKDAARERAKELLLAVGLERAEHHLKQFPHELSGGMLQRVMIASALACEPEVLLADEPTTALDVTTQAEIMAILRRLRDERGLTVLLVTHDLELAAAVCDRINVMYAGTIVEQQPSAALFENPRHPYTAGLLASSPRRVADGERLSAIPGRPLGLHEAPAGCVFSTRCAYVTDACEQARPPLAAIAGGRSACRREAELGALLPTTTSTQEVGHGSGR